MGDGGVWVVALGCALVGALCGYAWRRGSDESARAEGYAAGRAEGHTEGYAQGRADAVTVAKQQLAREMGHETTVVISVADAIRQANARMSRRISNHEWRRLNGQLEEEPNAE